MALLIPKSLPGGESQSLREFWRALKKLPETFRAWCAMDRTGDFEKPQVLILWREQYAFLVQVAETSQQLAEKALQGDLFDPNSPTPDSLGQAESDILSEFAEIAGREIEALPVHKLVVFPNVVAHTIDEIVLRKSDETDVQYLGLRQESADHFGRRLEAMAAAALSANSVIHLRKLLTPESIVPRSFNARAPIDRNTAAALSATFLDIDQEWCVKNDLELPPEHERIAELSDTRLITGVAGSGKSLILLYRAILFAKANPGSRVLVVTHNKPLRYELQRRSEILGGDRLECLTFFQWARSVLGDFPGNQIHANQALERVQEFKITHPSLANLTADYLIDEINWIKDQGIIKKENYFLADRKGRRTALRSEQKASVWEVFSAYQHHLQQTGSFDWHNIALQFHRAVCVTQETDFPKYDAIFIDEAQFFARIWFEIVKAALNPGGHLFLAADPTQGFLRRSQTWISAGIKVQGKTTRLANAYRNTSSILRFARQFYDERHTDDDELELNVPSDEMLDAMPQSGDPPEIIFVHDFQDEATRAINEIIRMRDELQFPPGQILLLHTDGGSAKHLAARLSQKLGSQHVHQADQGKRNDRAFCSIAGLNAATGLEAPIVFLLGMDQLISAENRPGITDDERADLARDNTRKLYMGFTRAGQKLIVFRMKRTAIASK